MTDRYSQLFNKLKVSKRKCSVPFLTIGDPYLELSYELIFFILKNKLADAIELGVPFSDPIADGPIIQKANIRSLKSGTTFKKCLLFIKNLRKTFRTIPIGMLIYANMIYQFGIDKFFSQCKLSEIDSVIIPDLPIEESIIFKKSSNIHNVHLISMCPPNADNILIEKISEVSSGFIYLISRAGVTGINKNTSFSNNKTINKIKIYSSIPILQGFGFSNEKQIKTALKNEISGIIFGSIIVRIIEKLCKKNINLMFKEIEKLLLSFKKLTKNFIYSKTIEKNEKLL